MGMGIKDMMAMRGALVGFASRHPKAATFVNDIRAAGTVPGQEIAVAVRYPDGREFKAGIRLTQEGIEMLETLKSMQKDAK